MPTIIQVSNSLFNAEHDAILPSKRQRRDDFANRFSLCWGCRKVAPRSKLSVCVKCKVARYCNKECQRTHWRAEHKSICSSATNPHINDVTLKLAEKSMSDNYILLHLAFYSILSLDLLNDRSNAKRFAINVICDTGPADSMAFILRACSGEGIDLDGPVRLGISSIRRVPMEEIPLGVQKVVDDGTKNNREALKALTPMVTLYFSCEGKGLRIGEIAAVFAVQEEQLEFMATKPKLTRKSPMFGITEEEMDMPRLVEAIDNYIERDKNNKLGLRMNRNGTAWRPTSAPH